MNPALALRVRASPLTIPIRQAEASAPMADRSLVRALSPTITRVSCSTERCSTRDA